MIECTMFLSFLVIAAFLVITKLLLNYNPKPLLGVYKKRNGVYWLKVAAMYLLLTIKKYCRRNINKSRYANMDKAQILSSSPLALDAVFFNGANANGEHLVLATARRPNKIIDGFLYLKLKKFGVLEFPKLPDTTWFNNGALEESYEAEGVKIHPVESMKKWSITYNGNLREANDHSKLHIVELKAEFSSTEPIFNYETMVNNWTLSKALAYEKWNRAYFKRVKSNHQFHYEQFGILKAKLQIDNKEVTLENLDCVRDHTIGDYREWGDYHRYVGHWISLANGDHFSIINLCDCLLYSRMMVGYYYNSRKGKMFAVTGTDFDIYHYGELGDPPNDYAFTFTTEENLEFIMQVKITDRPYFYISKGWEAKVFECLATFNVNGIKGWGGVEFQYRNVEGRNVKDS